MMIIEKTEDAVLFLSEAIENGYSYKVCIHEVCMSLNLDNNKREKITELMKNYKRDEDETYEKFEKDLKEIVEN